MSRLRGNGFPPEAVVRSLDEMRPDADRWEVMAAGYDSRTLGNTDQANASWFSLAWLLDQAHSPGNVSLRDAPVGLMLIARPCEPRESLT